MSVDEGRSNIEKLKGQFRLRINHNLDMRTKIGKFGQDPVAFHLHKQRNFVRKIEQQEVIDENEKLEAIKN